MAEVLVAWDTTPASANSYVTRAAAQAYFDLALHGGAWTAATDANKDAGLVTATRMLDRTRWMGDVTTPAHPLQWPRTGAIDRDGNAIASNVVPVPIREATYELCLAMLGDAQLQQAAGGGAGGVQSIGTSQTNVTFFGAGTAAQRRRFPQIIQELCGYLMLAFEVGAAGTSYGTDEDDDAPYFEDEGDEDNSRSEPYG